MTAAGNGDSSEWGRHPAETGPPKSLYGKLGGTHVQRPKAMRRGSKEEYVVPVERGGDG